MKDSIEKAIVYILASVLLLVICWSVIINIQFLYDMFTTSIVEKEIESNNTMFRKFHNTADSLSAEIRDLQYQLKNPGSYRLPVYNFNCGDYYRSQDSLDMRVFSVTDRHERLDRANLAEMYFNTNQNICQVPANYLAVKQLLYGIDQPNQSVQ